MLLREKRFSFFLLPPLRTVLGTWNDHSTETLFTAAITISAELVVTDPAILIEIEVPFNLVFLWHPRHIYHLRSSLRCLHKRNNDQYKTPPGREKMYDLGAKKDVFLRCNAIKMFNGRTLPCSVFGTELDDDYLSDIYRQIIRHIVPTIMNYFKTNFSTYIVLWAVVIHLFIIDNAIANMFLKYSTFLKSNVSRHRMMYQSIISKKITTILLRNCSW